MIQTHLLPLLLLLLPKILSLELGDVTVVVRGSSTIAETDDSFVCATIDWWPPEKCNYRQCPWGQASALNLDLKHPILAEAIQAFSPLRIRVGGSLQDSVVYGVPSLGYPCHPFSKTASGLFGFSQGCLGLSRWDALNNLFTKTGAVVTFGLNALNGRHIIHRGVWGGPWNSSNARDFMKYTISKNYPVDSWEFGNELSGSGVSASVGADQYGKDLIKLQEIVTELYGDSHQKPLIVAPGGFYDQQWYTDLLEASGSGVLNAVTHHIYNLGGGGDPNIASRITDPQYLSRIADTFRDLQLMLQRHGPWASAWVGEAGGVYNSGSRTVSNTFLNSFWYLDQLGLASKYGTKVYCRQTLIGGNYGLLDTTTFVPNPDYYSALLWHRLMGKGVLSVDVSGSPYLRAYAHCRRQKGGISLALINLHSSVGFSVAVRNDMNIDLAADDGGIVRDGIFLRGLKRTVSWVGRRAVAGSEKREEYHLTPKDGKPLSRTVLLNGTPLELTKGGGIPPLTPVLLPVNSPILVAPSTIAFIVFPNFEAAACSR